MNFVLRAGHRTFGRTSLVAAFLAFATGCDDPSGPKVATVTVTAPAESVEMGKTLQLTASASSRSGKPVQGKSFTWASDNDAVASVSSTGLVTGKSVGAATITATASGKSGTYRVTVAPVAVATVRITPDTAVAAVGSTRQLTATLLDAAGGALTGRTVAWTSSNDAVAGVGATGLVTARAVGSAVITAESGGKRDTATVTVVAPQAARVDVSPLFATLDVDGTTTLSATPRDAAGNPLAGVPTTWSSTSGTVATVSQTGTVTGVAAGRVGIVARSGTAADTATVTVLSSRSLLSTAFAGGAIRTDVRPGQTVTVPVTLDMSRVSSNGDLGALQFELAFDTTTLRFRSGSSTLSGSTDFNLVSPGRLRFVFAGTTPQGSSRLTLVTFTFDVPSGATVGARSALELVYPSSTEGRPRSTTFASYETPIAVGGRIRVVSP